MDNLQDQIRALQTSVRRQRFAIVALGAIFVGSALIGAMRQGGDAAYDKITCNTLACDSVTARSWRLVDHLNKIRLEARERVANEVAIYWFDRSGKLRIASGTEADGRAYTGWFDSEGAQRVSVGISESGVGETTWADRAGKPQIWAGTKPDGTAFFVPPSSK